MQLLPRRATVRFCSAFFLVLNSVAPVARRRAGWLRGIVFTAVHRLEAFALLFCCVKGELLLLRWLACL